MPAISNQANDEAILSVTHHPALRIALFLLPAGAIPTDIAQLDSIFSSSCMYVGMQVRC